MKTFSLVALLALAAASFSSVVSGSCVPSFGNTQYHIALSKDTSQHWGADLVNTQGGYFTKVISSTKGAHAWTVAGKTQKKYGIALKGNKKRCINPQSWGIGEIPCDGEVIDGDTYVGTLTITCSTCSGAKGNKCAVAKGNQCVTQYGANKAMGTSKCVSGHGQQLFDFQPL